MTVPTKGPKLDRGQVIRKLRAENKALRTRLGKAEEAEQALDAIRSGAVDAVLVSGPAGEQVYTLQGAERPYRVLMEALHAGAITLAPDGTILYANAHFADMLALRLEQVIGAPFTRFLPRPDLPRLLDMLAKTEVEPTTGEVTLKRGRRGFPAHLALRRLALPDLQAICVVVTDMTERKAAEAALEAAKTGLEARVAERTAALAASEQRFREAVDQFPSVYVIYDRERRIEFMNAVGCKLAGRPLAECVGKRDEDLWGAEVTRHYLPHLRRACKTKQTQTFEISVTLPTANLSQAVTYIPLLDDAGQLRQVLGITQDLTEHKRAEAVLREAVEQREAALEIARLGTWEYDTATGLTRLDARSAEIFGVSEAQPLSTDRLLLLIHPEDRGRVATQVQAALAGPGTYNAEYRLQRGDGTERWVVDRGRPIFTDEGGKPRVVKFLGTLLDITERKRGEAALRVTLSEKDAALATNQALLREVHHRVKNNLQMLCDLMYLQIEALPNPDEQAHLQDAYGRIYAIARLHEQLYQSIESGRVRLADYLTRLAAGFGNLFPGVPVKIHEAPSDAVTLDLDRAIHVGLIVNELITNAMKHAFPRGHAGEVTVTLRSLEEQVQVEVHDNGRGLPADLDLQQTKSLGLRTVYILARRLDAEVEVADHGGARFTITFPARGDDPVEPRAVPEGSTSQ